MQNNEKEKVSGEREEAKKQLERKKIIDSYKEIMAEKANRFLPDGTRFPKDFGHTQIRRLVELVQKCSSLIEMEAYIRYQIGRDGKKNNWAISWPQKSSGSAGGSEVVTFGEALIKLMDEVKDEVEIKGKENNINEDKQLVLDALGYLYGYLAWRAKYLNSRS